MVRLKISIGRTVNLGNYESLRVDVGIEDDVTPDRKDEWIEKAQAWLESHLVTIIADHAGVNIEPGEAEELLEDLGKITKPAK